MIRKANTPYHLILACTIFSGSRCTESRFIDIAAQGYEQYQDIVINNEIVKPATHGHHHCAQRYEIIRQVLDQFKRPFTMLDLGASQGYYSFRTAHDYECVCVMIEGNNSHYPKIGTQLLDLCKANTNLDNIIMLNKQIEIDDLIRLGECEHFDVILALNIIHWFGNEWKRIADAILELGNDIIIETPPQEPSLPASENQRRQAIRDYLVNEHGATIIGTVPRHTRNVDTHLYFIKKDKCILRRKTWLMPLMNEETHIITSNYTEKTLAKHMKRTQTHKYRTTPWIPGIDLVTFKMYHGAFPEGEVIKGQIEKLSKLKHGDWQVNNIIVQGNHLDMIDFEDAENPGHPYRPSAKREYLRFVELTDPREIEHHFWKVLLPAVYYHKTERSPASAKKQSSHRVIQNCNQRLPQKDNQRAMNKSVSNRRKAR